MVISIFIYIYYYIHISKNLNKKYGRKRINNYYSECDKLKKFMLDVDNLYIGSPTYEDLISTLKSYFMYWDIRHPDNEYLHALPRYYKLLPHIVNMNNTFIIPSNSNINNISV